MTTSCEAAREPRYPNSFETGETVPLGSRYSANAVFQFHRCFDDCAPFTAISDSRSTLHEAREKTLQIGWQVATWKCDSSKES